MRKFLSAALGIVLAVAPAFAFAQHPTVASRLPATQDRNGIIINGAVTPDGPELVTNGGFVGNAIGWTLGSDAAYGSNNVVSTNAGGDPTVSQDIATVSGTAYIVRFTVSGVGPSAVLDGLSFYFDNNSEQISTQNSYGNGTFSVPFVADFTGTDTIHFADWFYNAGSTWTLTNVSIKAVTGGLAKPITIFGAGGGIIGFIDETNFSLALGSNALGSDAPTTGNGANVAIGMGAMQSNISSNGNVAVGITSLKSNSSGNNNTAIGLDALFNSTTGNSNTALGASALKTNTTGTNNVAIGNNANAPTATTSNSLNIANVVKATGTNVPSTSVVTVPGILAAGAPSGTAPSTGDVNISGSFKKNGTAVGVNGSGATDHISFQPGIGTPAVLGSARGVFHKFSKAGVVNNIVGSASLFACAVNPVITLTNCHTDATCGTSPTTIGTVTVTASGAGADGSISNSAIAAGEYIAGAVTSGTCTTLNIAASAEIQLN